MKHELVIRVTQDSEGRTSLPKVVVEVDGVPVGLLSHLRFEADSTEAIPHLDIEILRGFCFKQDLSEGTLACVEKGESALRNFPFLKLKSPV